MTGITSFGAGSKSLSNWMGFTTLHKIKIDNIVGGGGD
jgi:hypothetical protein